MGLVYRGEYKNPEMIELELEQIDKRILVWPRTMTTAQRDSLTQVREGETIYNLTTHTLNYWNGTAWKVVTAT